NNRIRKVSGGTITNFAGGGSSLGDNGLALNGTLSGPTGLAIDGSNNVYVADRNNGRIRKVSAGVITTVAGGGNGGDGGPATSALLYYTNSVAVDLTGNLFIADSNYRTIRKVAASNGTISSIYPTTCYSNPTGVATD